MKKEGNLSNEIPEGNERKKTNKVFVIAVVFLLLAIAAVSIYLGRMWYHDHASEKSYENIGDYYKEVSVPDVTEAELPDNPVDFAGLQKTNSDLYAWIKVPGTRVNYPIAQGNDDFFYLHHDYQKNYLFAGTLYTELCNKKDFSDPVTLIYGHNMYESEGTMFTTLHYFEDEDFFSKHDNFTIYMPGHILTYKIFSVFRYDNRHIMNSFDFLQEKVLKEFQNTLLSPRSTVKYTREVQLDKDSKIVILSTCCTGDKSVRLLVCGVLEKDGKTK